MNKNSSPKFILLPTKETEKKCSNNTTSKKLLIENIINKNNINFKQKTTLFKAKIPLINSYKCDFCERIFKNGQALGGHISQSHPKQSSKYQQKIEVRNSRTKRRELLYEARRRLFNSYHIDLNYLIKNKRKKEIKTFINIHKNEYKKELSILKSLNDESDENNINKNLTISSNV